MRFASHIIFACILVLSSSAHALSPAESRSNAIRPIYPPSPRPSAILINRDGADPWITSHRGKIFYTQTTGRDIRVWEAKSLAELRDTIPAIVWKPGTQDRLWSKEIWAPELHRLEGKWYIYFAADDGINSNHRMHVLESQAGPLGPYKYKAKLSHPRFDQWAIDGTVIEHSGTAYFAWSGWPSKKGDQQRLYLSKLKRPWLLDEQPIMISKPEHQWESHINEGPQFLSKNGKLFIVYSANRSWTDDYRLGMLRLKGSKVLRQEAWEKIPEPVFGSVSRGKESVFAPGHCSFYRDPDGEDWILYHVAKRRGSGWKREVRAQRWKWGKDEPSFGTPLPLRR
jgi:GH43 family beta-xylosidase